MAVPTPLRPPLFFQGIRCGDSFVPRPSDGSRQTTRDQPTVVDLERLGTSDRVIDAAYNGGYMRLHLLGGPVAFVSFEGIDGAFVNYWKPVFLLLRSATGHQIEIPLNSTLDGQGRLALTEGPGGEAGFRCFAGAQFHGNRYLQREGRRYSETVYEDVVHTLQCDPLPAARIGNRHLIAPAIINSPLPCYSLTNGNNVALVFPLDSAHRTTALWANRENLSRVSTYFARIFGGGYSESYNVLEETSHLAGICAGELARIAGQQPVRAGADLSSAPDTSLSQDGDVAASSPAAESLLDLSAQPPACSICYIVIRDASCRTDEAFLNWALTGKIEFERLTTSTLTPVNPKMVYKLAHQLNIQVLAQAAAEDFKSQLTYANVLEELFTPSCFSYPTLKEAALTVLNQQWAQVEVSGGLDNILLLIDAGNSDVREMMTVAFDILRRVHGTGNPRLRRVRDGSA